MTNSNTHAPVVKTSNPTLYENHTFHMQKARKYTYNYVAIDEVLVDLYDTMTVKEIAEALNEYPSRINYRVNVLKTLGLIKNKYNMERAELMRTRKVLVTWLDDVDNQIAAQG